MSTPQDGGAHPDVRRYRRLDAHAKLWIPSATEVRTDLYVAVGDARRAAAWRSSTQGALVGRRRQGRPLRDPPAGGFGSHYGKVDDRSSTVTYRIPHEVAEANGTVGRSSMEGVWQERPAGSGHEGRRRWTGSEAMVEVRRPAPPAAWPHLDQRVGRRRHRQVARPRDVRPRGPAPRSARCGPRPPPSRGQTKTVEGLSSDQLHRHGGGFAAADGRGRRSRASGRRGLPGRRAGWPGWRVPLALMGWARRAQAPPLTLSFAPGEAQVALGDHGDHGEGLVDLEEVDVGRRSSRRALQALADGRARGRW